MKKGMGEIERVMFAYMQMRGQTTLRIGELAKPLGLTPSRERNLLSRLAKAGWIVRVRRGLYLVPPTLQLGGKWSPDETQALNALMLDADARYQVCGPNAFNRYGYDGQVPAEVWAYNNRVSGRRSVGVVRLNLIKVADARLGGAETISKPGGPEMNISSRARTLVDAIYDWSRFNSLPRGYDWIRNDLSTQRVSAQELVEMALQFGDIATRRRMGFLLESEGVQDGLLRPLLESLRPTTGLIPWSPTAPKRGRGNRRWGVVVNDGS